jgi:hypothetical protein
MNRLPERCYGESFFLLISFFPVVNGSRGPRNTGEAKMHKKLSLIAGTALTITLFLLLHAVLALGTIFWIVALIPLMLFKWSIEDHKRVPVQSAADRRHRV